MPHIRNRLAFVARVITTVVPRVKSEGTYTPHSALMPSCWEMKAAEGAFLVTEGVLLIPDDPAPSTLLDIWRNDGRKILSVHWMEHRPWQPPHISCFRSNELLETLREDGCLLADAPTG